MAFASEIVADLAFVLALEMVAGFAFDSWSENCVLDSPFDGSEAPAVAHTSAFVADSISAVAYAVIEMFAVDDIAVADRRSFLGLVLESMVRNSYHDGRSSADARANNSNPDTFHRTLCTYTLIVQSK